MSDEAIPGLAVDSGPVGIVQRAIRQAVDAAQLDDRDQGMAAAAEAAARAVDLAHGRRDPYAVAAAVRELRETLIRLRLDPVSRDGQDAGDVEKWLSGLDAT